MTSCNARVFLLVVDKLPLVVLPGTFIFFSIFDHLLIEEGYVENLIFIIVSILVSVILSISRWTLGTMYSSLPVTSSTRHVAVELLHGETPTVLQLGEVCIHGFEIVQKQANKS